MRIVVGVFFNHLSAEKFYAILSVKKWAKVGCVYGLV